MEGSRFAFLRLLRWSLVVASAVGLWFVGYYLGRDAGLVRGHDDGFAFAREKGLEAGRLEGLRLAAANYRGKQVYERTYPVGALLDERLAKKIGGSAPSDQEMEREGKALVDEILADVFDAMGGPGFVPDFWVRYVPENRTLAVVALGSRHSELGIYLKSKDDYFAWKRAEEEPAGENSSAEIAGRPTSER